MKISPNTSKISNISCLVSFSVSVPPVVEHIISEFFIVRLLGKYMLIYNIIFMIKSTHITIAGE